MLTDSQKYLTYVIVVSIKKASRCARQIEFALENIWTSACIRCAVKWLSQGLHAAGSRLSEKPLA